ncbi:MAG: hypothetical protein ACJA0N_000237 [Pseudohongiellaceae bacterium]|jgi:hypothetical protein
MDQESVVYGCIKDTVYSDDSEQFLLHRENNLQVMGALPSIEGWPLINREMFSMPAVASDLDDTNTNVVHFGTSYKAIEYEWEDWIGKFEVMLKKMYWVSATVHLDTELNGLHTFTWESEEEFHVPDSGDLSVRCEWSRESLAF